MIILASGSPRRAKILRDCGVEFEIVKSYAPEVSYPHDPERTVRENALAKGAAVARTLAASAPRGILSADTIVYAPETDEVLGKPKDKSDAVRMLTVLSGRTHKVITGVTLRFPGGEVRSFAEVTEVTFRRLSAEEIEEYCAADEPYEKAGAYGIQGRACVFVEGICGDYFNVVGLPACKVYAELGR